jgi:PAS domain S-box-containing protein
MNKKSIGGLNLEYVSSDKILTDSFFDPSLFSGDIRILFDILNSIHESIIIINTQTEICYVNNSYLKMFSVRREQIVGKRLSRLEPLASINEVLRNKEPVVGNISHIHSANMDVLADVVPLFHGGELIGALALIKNVTELIETQRELEHFKKVVKALQTEKINRDNLPSAFHHIYGQSEALINALKIASKAACSDASICINGESGTGKELLVDAIHLSSKRSEHPLVKINCAAIPENLFESELFGYEAGAFTGARTGGKPGKFEMAYGGTVFLDEIGEMPLLMQAKLLRVLQEHEVERIGGNKQIKLDFRLVTATNRDLVQMISQKTFREDLYYRINVISISLPPLRERRNDIAIYAHIFLENMSNLSGIEYRFSEEALNALISYSWPGNVREMKNCIERAVVLSNNEVIGPEHLPIADVTNHIPYQSNLKLPKLLDNTEREAIITALRVTGNNKTRAIDLLGISRRNFYQKLKKYNLL